MKAIEQTEYLIFILLIKPDPIVLEHEYMIPLVLLQIGPPNLASAFQRVGYFNHWRVIGKLKGITNEVAKQLMELQFVLVMTGRW